MRWIILLVFSIAGSTALAAPGCDENAIRRDLLRHDKGGWIRSLEIIRGKGAFRGCDFTFSRVYEVNLYYSIEMTFVDEIRFYERDGKMCVTVVNVDGYKTAEGPRRSNAGSRLLDVVRNPTGHACISSGKLQKPASRRLFDWFRN